MILGGQKSSRKKASKECMAPGAISKMPAERRTNAKIINKFRTAES